METMQLTIPQSMECYHYSLHLNITGHFILSFYSPTNGVKLNTQGIIQGNTIYQSLPYTSPGIIQKLPT